MKKKALAPTLANLFQLHRGDVEISFAESDFGGQPNLTLTEAGVSRSFRGAEVEVETTAVGTLVTVTLEAIADGDSRLLSVLLPEVHVGPRNRERIRGVVQRTTLRGSLIGPAGVTGALQVYERATIFRGVASFVVS